MGILDEAKQKAEGLVSKAKEKLGGEGDVDRDAMMEDKAKEQIKEEKEKRKEVGDPEKMPPVED